MASYWDECKCPKCGYKFGLWRRTESAGKNVPTYCRGCRKMFKSIAGGPHNKAVETTGATDAGE